MDVRLTLHLLQLLCLMSCETFQALQAIFVKRKEPALVHVHPKSLIRSQLLRQLPFEGAI